MKQIQFTDLEVGQRLHLGTKFTKTRNDGYGYWNRTHNRTKIKYTPVNILGEINKAPKKDRWALEKERGIIIDNIVSVHTIKDDSVTLMIRQLIGGCHIPNYSSHRNVPKKFTPYEIGKAKKLGLTRFEFENISGVSNLGVEFYEFKDNKTFRRDLLSGNLRTVTKIVDADDETPHHIQVLMKCINDYNNLIEGIEVKLS